MNENVNVHDNYPDSNQSLNVPTMQVTPLKRICVTIGELPTAYIETMSYYEMLLWFIGYLRDNIIPAVNGNAEATQEVQEVVMNLQQYINNFKDSIDQDMEDLESYVNNYFNNLDVQDEIDHKLDEMLADGSFEQILENFFNKKIYYIDTLSDMKNYTGYVDGDYVETLGYYSVGDGGGANYRIVSTTALTPDDGSVIALQNNLYGIMQIKDNSIDIRQLGGKRFLSTDSTKYDNLTSMTRYLSTLNNFNEKYELYIPAGVWCFSETLISRFKGVNIRGEKLFPRDAENSTTIVPIEDNQKFIWKVGGIADVDDRTEIPVSAMTTSSHFEGLCFRSSYYENNKYTITRGCFYIDCSMYMTFEDIYVTNFIGNGLVIRSSWELYFKTLVFRAQIGFDYHSLMFANYKAITGVSANISALDIDSLMFENADGGYIYSEPYSGFSHNHINHINIETHWGGDYDTTERQTFETDTTGYTPIDIIKGTYRFFVIDSINLTYGEPLVAVKDETRYFLRSIVRDDSENAPSDLAKRNFITIGSISYRTVASRSKLSIYSGSKSYEYNGLSIGQISFQDGTPQVLFDSNYTIAPTIGTIFAVNKPLINTSPNNDAYLYACRRNVCYDSTAPTEYKLVARRRPSTETNANAIVEWHSEKYADTTNPLTFSLLVKNNTDSNKGVDLYTYVNGTNTSSHVSVPSNDNAWQLITFSRAVDLGSLISFRSSSEGGDISVAKIYY